MPYLGVVMSLVGALLTMTISIIFPAAASLKLHGNLMSFAEKLWATFVCLIGVICALSGTASALLALKAKLLA
jgi:solute carrier family 32 (vesicular inhibitory amino acid transporter)